MNKFVLVLILLSALCIIRSIRLNDQGYWGMNGFTWSLIGLLVLGCAAVLMLVTL